MSNTNGNFSNAVGNGAASERIRILAICLAGASALGGKLKDVLQQAHNVDLVLESFRSFPIA